MQATTSQQSESTPGCLKLMVVGDATVGKTSLVRRWAHDTFTANYKATIGCDFALKEVLWNGRDIVKVQFWDLAGQERFANLTRHYYTGAVGAFIVFDKTKATPFFKPINGSGKAWKKDIDDKVNLHDGTKIPVVLLCNKCDLESKDPLIDEEAVQKYAQENGYAGCFFVSAYKATGTDEALKFLIKKIFELDPDAEKRMLQKSEGIKITEPKNKPATEDDCAC